jgi:glycosyltransferase involved in cell wall biosynthesis
MLNLLKYHIMNPNQSPLISIITVVYNGGKTLEQTIQSVLNQSYTNIEYIIIDGGSTDGTIDIIKKHEKDISFWVSEPDKGLYDAMNKGISYAKGELIGMINSDDWYELNAVDLIVKTYIKNPSKRIFHGDRYDILEEGTRKVKKFHPSKFKFIYYGMTYNHPSMFIHNEIYRNEKYNINLHALSDYEFVLGQYLREPKNFIYIPKSYVNYRLDGISAQLKFVTSIQEGFVSRKNAGINIIQNLISVVIRILAKAKPKLS